MPNSRNAIQFPGSKQTEKQQREPGVEQSPRLLDRVRLAIRTRHYSPRTEKASVVEAPKQDVGLLDGELVRKLRLLE